MSRQRKTLIAAAFTYAQWLLGTTSALYVTRFLVRSLGPDRYGLWLASGSLLGYAAFADLGILSIMPWLFAEADGQGDAEKKKSLLAHGVATGVAGGIIYAALAGGLYYALPRFLHLSTVDFAALRGPILSMIALTAVAYPLRLFSAFRTGLQDYTFLGICSIAQTVLNVVLVVLLTMAGAGLYGVALGAALPATLTAIASLLRSLVRDPALFHAWPKLRWSVTASILSSGTGAWLATIGWSLAFASDSVIIAFLGYRQLIPMFVVTSRLGLTLMQMSWALPDSASVGLAQLSAEGRGERVSEVIGVLLRMHLLTAGVIACGVIAGNFGFVSGWIGPDLYAGGRVNAVFAVDVVLLSIVHALMVPAAVLGRRLQVGFLTLLNGALHIALALALGRHLGLLGVALATALSALLTTVPWGLRLIAQLTPLTVTEILRHIGLPWLLRLVPCALAGAILGWLCTRAGVVASLGRYGALGASLVAGCAAGLLYLYGMRPLTRDLPFGPRLRRVLYAVRLL